MKICPGCGAENPQEAGFCLHCGAALAGVCSRCGANLPGSARFCPACGQPVGSGGGEPHEERKLVSVLFADVTGSTSLGEQLDPEHFKAVMETYFAAMRREIEAEGGSIEKFIGDAVVAVFGVPAAHEDDPDRSLRAALRMRGALHDVNRRLSDSFGVSLAMRVGIHSGQVMAVTHPGPDDWAVSGDTMNVAARLEQRAEPGQILVSERTVRASTGFDVREIGPLSLKGKELAVHVFELVGGDVRPEHERSRFGAPIVGREQEIAVLHSIFERVRTEGRPHLVTVYGDAGVGKTRLAREFVTRVRALEEPPEVAWGRTLPYGEGVTYWPLAEILKRHTGVLDSDSPGDALRKIRDVGGAFLAGISDDPGRAVEALCLTVGLEDPAQAMDSADPRQVRAEISSAWGAYFSARARLGPVVVVVEDIHWADSALLDLLEDVADRSEGPLLFLCPSRPEVTARRPDWGGGKWNFSNLLLEPLSALESGRLVELLLDTAELPVSLRARILERSGGNPFFLEEIVRQLVDEGRVVATAEGWRAATGADEIEIPDTVQGVLSARLDLLQPSEKRVLQLAAVVGPEFWTGLVAQLAGAEGDSVEQTLARLEDRGLVRARLASTLAGQREYAFNHVLIRDVAHDSLPRRERAATHAQVAGWITELAGQRGREFVELLAYHYGEAYRGAAMDPRAEPEPTEGLRREAYRSALVAAESLRTKLVLDGSQRQAEAAVSLAADPLERAEALETLGKAAYLDYQGDQAWRCLKEAVDLRREATPEDRAGLARLALDALEVATRGRGTMRSRLDRADAAPYLEVASSGLPPEDRESLARLLVVQAFWPFSFRDQQPDAQEAEAAMVAGERGAEIALEIGEPSLASAALDGVCHALQLRGLYGRLDPVLRRRLALVPELEDPAEVGDIYAVAAWSSFHVGRYREAEGLADEGFERSVRGAPGMALHCLDWRALARCRLGEWESFLADAALAQELLGKRSQSPPGFAADHVAAAAFVHEVQGDGAAAERSLAVLRWLQQAEERPWPGWAVWVALLLARRGDAAEALATLDDPSFQTMAYGKGLLLEALCSVVAEVGAWERAPGAVEQSRAHAAEAGLLALPAFADRLDGLIMLDGGDAEQAARSLVRASDAFAGLGASWEAACTDLYLAAALRADGRADEARTRLGSALRVFERLRSGREIERARLLLSDLD